MKLYTILTASFAILVLATLVTPAATSRESWIVQQIYNYNHPFAANLPDELATKISKMSQNPFSFYRGTAHLFYADMANTTVWPPSTYSNSVTDVVWLEGDMHMQNMGGFRDANGNAVFDTNDFDEGYWGPYIWDLRRMSVAIILAAAENGISSSDQESLVKNFVGEYSNQISDFKGNDGEKTWRLTSSNTNGVVKDTIQKADSKSRSDLLMKYTDVSSDQRHFVASSKLQIVDSTTFSSISNSLPFYISSIASSKRYDSSFYTLKDAALRIGAGTGSLGRYRYFLLIEGSSTSNSDDVILEMKQETDSSVAIAGPGAMPTWVYSAHNGQRVSMTQKAMLNNADVLIGYTTMNDLDFYLQERSPYQEDFDYTRLTSYNKFNDAVKYMGQVIAKNHALADKDYNPDLISSSMDKEITDVIGSDTSSFKIEILNFALSYTSQVEQDYNDFIIAKNNDAIFY